MKEKELLLKDLCGRLPYGVICTDNRHGDSRVFYMDVEDESVYYTDFDEYGLIENCKPYLRPMSSMTSKEKDYLRTTQSFAIAVATSGIIDTTTEGFDWLNEHHFDYRHLIGRGLALEAPEGMYKIE